MISCIIFIFSFSLEEIKRWEFVVGDNLNHFVGEIEKKITYGVIFPELTFK